MVWMFGVKKVAQLDLEHDSVRSALDAHMRKWSAVAPNSPRCRIAYNRRTGRSAKEIREAVSDRGKGVRSSGERPPKSGAPKE